MGDTKYLSSLQMSVMRILWARGEATVADVHADLQRERVLAPTTIATVLSRLEAYGLVRHHTEERRYVYRPLVSEAQVRRSMVADLVDRLFQGDPSAMINHLLTESSVDETELDAIKALIKAREQNGKDSDD